MTVTKKDIIDRITDTTGLRRSEVRGVVQALFDEIASHLADGRRIEFRDFGVFEVRMRAARAAQNPKTLERVQVPRRASVRFKPGRAMRDRIEGAGPGASSVVEPKPRDGARAARKSS